VGLKRVFGLLALLVSAAACGESPRTQVMLVVSTDFAIPTEVDEFSVTAAGPDMVIQMATASLTSSAELPRTLALVHEGGPLTGFDVTVSATLADAEVVSRRVRFSFQEGQTLSLPIFLGRDCAMVSCAGDDTCVEGACASIDIDSSELGPWPPPAPDAGMDSGTDAAPDAGDAAMDAPVDSSLPDTMVPVDAAGECNALYSGVRDYAFCVGTPSACEFYSNPPGPTSCEDTCAMGGGTCLEAFQSMGTSAPDNCMRGPSVSCGNGANNLICVCSR
jgi:hypothetical protein